MCDEVPSSIGGLLIIGNIFQDIGEVAMEKVANARKHIEVNAHQLVVAVGVELRLLQVARAAYFVF